MTITIYHNNRCSKSRDTLALLTEKGLDPAAMLADNDSTGFFAALDDLLRPGPTLTNVNDLRAILIDPAAAS